MNTPSLSRYLLLSAFVAVVALFWTSAANAQTGFSYFPLTPCRVVDTRNPPAVNGGPNLTTATRDFQVRGVCGVPSTAKAVAINVTVVNQTAVSWLTLWPSGQTKPFVSALNFDPNSGAVGNGAIIGLSTNTQDLSVANAIGICHVIIDVTGYYQ